MNSIVLVFAAALAVAHGGVIAHYDAAPVAKTTVLQGPSTSAHVVGNDGHGIVAHAPGASITATEEVGGAAVAYSAPVVAHHAAYAAPVVAHHAAYAAPVVAHHAAYAAPVVAHHAAYAHHGAYAAPVVAHHGVYGADFEGQYVHDYSETLYDDGSYKGEVY